MNKIQKIILAIFVPSIIFFLALIIANSLGYTVIYCPAILIEDVFDKYKGDVFDKYKEPITYYHEGNPFDWKRTWYIWFLSLIFCCIFEYKLFGDKKK